MEKGPIVLLTDFGLRDHFVGVMKGVILARAPKSTIVDLSHEVPPQDLRAGALLLLASVPYFPKGSLFVCVVDPGVGSSRRILWARTDRHQYLVPDNGILSWLPEAVREWREVSNTRLFLPEVSATFHGRDIFAPVAAALARGLSSARLGPVVRDPEGLAFPGPARRGHKVRGEILAFDRFGNAVTNLGWAEARYGAKIHHKGRLLGPVRTHYGETRDGAALALFGSTGLLELSVRNGSFAKRFKARIGDKIESRG